MPVNTPHPVKMLGTDIQTGALVTATAPAPTAVSGFIQYITAIIIKVTQIAAQAAAPFDVSITGLEGGTIVVPFVNPGAVGDAQTVQLNFTHPVRSNGAVAVVVTGTPTANTRMHASVYGFQAP